MNSNSYLVRCSAGVEIQMGKESSADVAQTGLEAETNEALYDASGCLGSTDSWPTRRFVEQLRAAPNVFYDVRENQGYSVLGVFVEPGDNPNRWPAGFGVIADSNIFTGDPVVSGAGTMPGQDREHLHTALSDPRVAMAMRFKPR